MITVICVLIFVRAIRYPVVVPFLFLILAASVSIFEKTLCFVAIDCSASYVSGLSVMYFKSSRVFAA